MKYYFTEDEIRDLLPIQDILETDEEEGTVRMLCNSIVRVPLAHRIYSFLGISEEAVECGEYENSWIDTRIIVNTRQKIADEIIFDINANTGDRKDDHELILVIDDTDESEMVYKVISETGTI